MLYSTSEQGTGMTQRKINQGELDKILRLHELWLMGDDSGKRVILRYGDFRGADLRGANLRHAYLRGADLRRVNLCGAYLRGVNFWSADLRGAQFSQTTPFDCDIRGSKWLHADIPWWLGHPDQDQIILCEE